jgi:hypothetical protein
VSGWYENRPTRPRRATACWRDYGPPGTDLSAEPSGLPAEFPPLRSLGNPALPNNLPVQLSSFIGRERQVAEVRALVESYRLVTLTGAGGAGKTRLGLRVAAELLDGPGMGSGWHRRS